MCSLMSQISRKSTPRYLESVARSEVVPHAISLLFNIASLHINLLLILRYERLESLSNNGCNFEEESMRKIVVGF